MKRLESQLPNNVGGLLCLILRGYNELTLVYFVVKIFIYTN